MGYDAIILLPVAAVATLLAALSLIAGVRAARSRDVQRIGALSGAALGLATLGTLFVGGAALRAVLRAWRLETRRHTGAEGWAALHHEAFAWWHARAVGLDYLPWVLPPAVLTGVALLAWRRATPSGSQGRHTALAVLAGLCSLPLLALLAVIGGVPFAHVRADWAAPDPPTAASLHWEWGYVTEWLAAGAAPDDARADRACDRVLGPPPAPFPWAEIGSPEALAEARTACAAYCAHHADQGGWAVARMEAVCRSAGPAR